MFDKKAIIQIVGYNLKRLRSDKKLSMQALATLAEMEKSQIFKIEKAKIDVQVSTLSNLAHALREDISEFFLPI